MTTFVSVSVLTLIRGRQAHFDHLIAGLRAQVSQPDELVVAHMQPEPPDYPDDLPFSVRFVRVDGDPLPLAKARNSAAKAANGDVLAFLDVDCIADTQFVRRAREACAVDARRVFLPEVRYLPAQHGSWMIDAGVPDYDKLKVHGERHPAKPNLEDCSIAPIDDFGELWGLSFILSRDTWKDAGGMDEAYIGYGAEETDFAERLRTSGAQLYWLGGTICFHQHHTVCKPPLQHFDTIVRNARTFHDRWGRWCMDYWLDDFARRGLVRRSGDELRVLRRPSRSEVAASEQPPHVRFS